MIETGKVYHVFSKSIAEFKVFNSDTDFSRIIDVISYYQKEKPSLSFSNNIKIKKNSLKQDLSKRDKLIEIIAYCIMPTHLHLVLKQVKDKGIATFMSNILNSYSRYFNIKHSRKGPLWAGRFQRVLVETNEQLLHLTRYVHLNPVSAYLVNNPEDWLASSYREYIFKNIGKTALCEYNGVLEIESKSYEKFVESRISYQRELTKIK